MTFCMTAIVMLKLYHHRRNIRNRNVLDLDLTLTFYWLDLYDWLRPAINWPIRIPEITFYMTTILIILLSHYSRISLNRNVRDLDLTFRMVYANQSSDIWLYVMEIVICAIEMCMTLNWPFELVTWKYANRKLIYDLLYNGNSNVCTVCHHLQDIRN